MLSRFSRHALRKSSQANGNALKYPASRRGYVQPSVADRASVVDIPSVYRDDSNFSPPGCYELILPGMLDDLLLCQVCSVSSLKRFVKKDL